MLFSRYVKYQVDFKFEFMKDILIECNIVLIDFQKSYTLFILIMELLMCVAKV